jgi:phosphoserine phosphatase RsbX
MVVANVTASPREVVWGVQWRAHQDEIECGDVHVVREFPRGDLAAVIDGLGHGPEAAAASGEAVAALQAMRTAKPADAIRLCHEALKGTRGAVITCAFIDNRSSELTWVGAGNVEAVLVRAARQDNRHEWLSPPGGIVGYKLPTLRERRLALEPNDTLAFATDGLSPKFVALLDVRTPPSELALRVIDTYRTRDDDALILIGRFGVTPS